MKKTMNKTKSTRGVTLRVMFVAALVLLFAAAGVVAVSAENTWDGTSTTAFTVGDGSENNPYQISTGAELAYLANVVNNGTFSSENTFFRLMNDINLDNKAWTPIGNTKGSGGSTSFRGYFDGNGKTISNLKIDESGESNLGLFGAMYASNNGSISNLKIDNVIINGRQNLGALVGTMQYGKTINNCRLSGHVEITGSNGTVGGLIGRSRGGPITISECIVDVDSGSFVKSIGLEGVVGGIVAGPNGIVATGFTLSDCTSNIDIIGSKKLGGIIGQVNGKYDDKVEHVVKINNVKSYGKITVVNPEVGDGYYGSIVGSVFVPDPDKFDASDFTNWVCISNSESHVSIEGWDEIKAKSYENRVGLVGAYRNYFEWSDTLSLLRACVVNCNYYVTSDADAKNLVRSSAYPNELFTGGNLITTSGSSEVRYMEPIDYTVTIPALFDFGSNLALQSEVAVTVLVPDDEHDVKMTVTEVDGEDKRELTSGSNKVIYNIGSVVGGKDILRDVFTADGSIAAKQPKTLYFTLKEKPTHAGLYTGTLTFTTEVISVSNQE